MCGIAGRINFNRQPVHRNMLMTMANAMAHRGPDGEGFYDDGCVGLAHRRLSIIDPEKGHQPFIDKSSGLALVCNGEIYNFLELRDELSGHCIFRTQSDTEVLLQAYAYWGIGCLDKLRGMFAFALHDSRRKKLYLVRDRLGIKPLYYYYKADSSLYFASELSALLAAEVPREIDGESVAGYFRWQYIPTPKSIYKNIYKLEPGHYLEIDLNSGNINNVCYWKLQPNPSNLPEEVCLEQLNAELDNVLRIYVRSDVPFGAFLSGGVDSSLVTALMSRQLNEPAKTFSIGFNERNHSELPFAAKASKTIGTNHYEKIVSPKAALDVLVKLTRHFGEPFADSSAVPTYYVSQVTAGEVKMVLSGDGGDELFGGYWSYIKTFQDMKYPIPTFLRKTASNISSLAPQSKIGRSLGYIAMQPLERHIQQRQIFTLLELKELLNAECSTDWPYKVALSEIKNEIDDISCFQYLDLRTYLLDDILTKVDRMSMANSLEVRVPLLDHKIVELAFQLPLSAKLHCEGRQVRTKHLLKLSAERFFPSDFLDRPKMGFGIPIIEWCQNDLKENILDAFNNRNAPSYEWLNYNIVQKILNEFFSGRNNRAAHVWALLMFDIWMRNVHKGFQ